MSRPFFFLLCLSVLVLSLGITFIWGCNDKITLFIGCLGTFSTIATLIVAYIIFISYSSPADIQKKKFELVDKALAFFITKRFYGMIPNGSTYFLYLTKQRLDNLTEGIIEDGKNSTPVIISLEFFDFLSDFQSQLENHYFPFELKMVILSNLPQGGEIVSSENITDQIKITLKYDDKGYAYIPNNGQPITCLNFIDRMNIVRTSMIDFLNDKVPSKHRIVDQRI